MKKIISFVKDLPRQWKAETPVICKYIRNVAGVLAVAIPTICNTCPAGLVVPEWFLKYSWYIFAACLFVTGAAGTKEFKKDE